MHQQSRTCPLKRQNPQNRRKFKICSTASINQTAAALLGP